IAAGILLLARYALAGIALVVVGLALFATWIANSTIQSPEIVMAVAALPVCALAALMAQQEFRARRLLTGLPVLAALFVALASWVWTPPRHWNQIYVVLPQEANAYEAKFYKNYIEALNFAGIAAKEVKNPTEVPAHGFLLIPWATSPI